jgi:hypothetical protein
MNNQALITKAPKALLSALLIFLCALAAKAHVKWFVEYDTAKPPLPIGEVLSGTFIKMFLVCVAGIYLFFLVDRYIYKKGYLAEFDQKLRRFDDFSSLIMRASAGVFFLSLWAWYMYFGTSFYITPELKTNAAYVPWLHLALAVFLVSRYTTPLAGVGIFVLFAASIFDYGLFHLLDYLIFLGIGYFLIVSSFKSPKWLKSGFIVLFACAGLTLIWASIEKFGYPEWTFPMLEQNPDMTMGLKPATFMLVSGFVEFSLTFVLLGAVSIVGRMISLGMMMIFILAVFKFGMVDAVGHLMIVAILFVLVVRGPTDARNMLVLSDKNVWTEAYFMTGLYFLAFVMIFILYYGLHFLFYGV